MVVCTVSPASGKRKENLDGSSSPMVACKVSRATVSRKDKPQSSVCCHGCLYCIACLWFTEGKTLTVLPLQRLLARCLVPLFRGKINLKVQSAAMVVCTVSPASGTRKENLDGSSAPMVACKVSRATVSRKDKSAKFVCCHGCLYCVICLCRKKGELQRLFCNPLLLALCLILLFQGKKNLIQILLLT